MSGNGALEAFIARWQGREGGQERANYGMFLSELCQTFDLPIPDPAGATTEVGTSASTVMVGDQAREGGEGPPHPRLW